MGKLTTYIENQKIAPATATKAATTTNAKVGKLTAYIEENGIAPQPETENKSTSIPLITTLSSNKPITAPTASAIKSTKGFNLPTANERIKTGVLPTTEYKPINTNTQNTIQSPYDNKTEQFAYDLGKSLGSANPNTIPGAVRYGLAKGVQGVAGAAEGIADLAYGGGSAALGWLTSLGGLAPNSFAQGFTDNAKKAFETDIAGSIGKGIADKSEVEIAKPIQFGGDVYNVAGNLLTGLGAGKAASGATKLASDLTSKLAIGATAGGQSAQQAYQEGASVGKALTYGAATGMLEASIESIAGGIPGLGKGVVGKAMEKLTSKAPAAVQAVMSAAGEGAEEVLSDFITPYLQRIVYNPNAENATLEQMAKDFALGAGLSGLMQGAGAIGKINTAKSNVTTPQTSTQNAANNVDNATQIAPNVSTKVNTTQNATQAPTIAPNLQRVVSPVSTENATQGNVTADTKNNAVTAESSVGAATGGFVPKTQYSIWSENTANNQFHDVGENAVRSVDLPKINLQGESTMKTAATVMESQNTPDARVEEIQSAMVDGKMAYVPIENKSVAEKANAKIKRNGWQTALNDWTSNVRSGKVSPDLVAEGATLLNNAGNAAECTKEAYINLLTDYANLVHASGQSLQAARILKTLTPEARLYAMQRSVQKINEGINQKSGAKKQTAKTADENAKAVSDEITDEVVKKVKRKTTSKKSADEKTDIDRAAEQLASKVDSTTKARKPVEVNAINDMVNELFKSAKESPLPERVALAKRSPIEFLTQAIKNKSEYAETWNSAKEILLEKYADNQPVLDMLNDFFKKGIVPTYSDATLTSSVKQAIKDLDTKLSEIKELSWANRQKAIKAITNYLVEQTGAVDGDAKALRRDAADKITMLIIDSAPKLTQKQKLEIKQATQDAMRNHGVPLESWEAETGRLLSENLSKRLDAPKTPKPTAMTKTILGDLVKFAEEHALPSRQIAPKLNRTAAARITDFFNNRSFYAKAWNEAQKVMREKYADNQEVLDQFDEWLNSTIGYNADGTNAVMQKAIMDAAIEGDISLKQIRDNKALGNTDSVINRIYSKLAAEVKPEGADAITLKDAVTRFVTEKTAKIDADAQLERFIRSALKDINAKFSSVIGKPSAEKTAMQSTVTDMLIKKYGIDKADAEIVSKTISEKFDEMFLNTMNEHTEIKINADLAEKYRKATTDEERDAIVSEIQQDIADQVPSSGLDKWTALRYVNMLGNFKTQIRNVAGNATMMGVTKTKNEVAAGLEHIASAVSGGKFERTKSFVVSKEMYSAAYADFKKVQKAALGEGKYNETNATNDFERGINEKRTIFKVNGEWGTKDNSSVIAKGARSVTDVGMKVLEGYRKITNQAMEVGDVIFSRITYADALAGYLKAHNVTAEQVRNGEVDTALMDKARLYAIKEAQEATFRDTNAFSKAVSNFDSNWGKGGKIISKGILPFRKTVANIMVRAEEYSPLGIINTAVKAVQAAQGAENVSGADVINSLSKTLTGSGVLYLGWTLAKMGLLFGKDDDENQSAFNSLTGRQNYSITLPNGMSFTVDWLTPASMPLFVGAALYDLAAENGLKANDVESVITSITDPIVKMSMMAGVNDALSNIKYSDNNLMQFVLSSAANYLTQGLTNTMLGQIERTSEKLRMSTYTDPTSLVPDWLQRTGGKASAKTPGVDYNQGEYVDAWGRTQNNGTTTSKIANNFFNPAYMSTVNETALEKELQRLYDSTGDGSVVPKRVTDKSFKTYDGEYAMTPSEQVKFQKTRGQYAYKELSALTKSADYKAMSDSEKVKAVSDIYSTATQNAKQTIVEARGEMYFPDTSAKAKYQEIANTGISQKQAYTVYKAFEALEPEAGASEVSVYQKISTIGKQGLTDKQATALVGTLYTTHDEDGNVSKESLLPYLNTSIHLLSLYMSKQDSELVNMTIPATFTSNKVEYALTDTEKKLFKDTYTSYFNSRVTNVSSDTAIKSADKKAYEAAKAAVIKSRNS